jgi:hypothetical protein
MNITVHNLLNFYLLMDYLTTLPVPQHAYRFLVEKLEGKRPLGRPGRMWEYNIKWDLRKIG